MNFGRSLAARQAIADGRWPASRVAVEVGHGCTSAWVLKHVASYEWHHVQANLGGDGRPTNFYMPEDVLAAWLAANWHAARSGNKVAARRLPGLRTLRRDWGVEAQVVAYALAEAPAPVAREKIVPVPAGDLWVTRRVYERTRGRYVPDEVVDLAPAAEYRGAWLVWAGGRCKRDSVLATAPASAADLAWPEAWEEDCARRKTARTKREADLAANRKTTRAADEQRLIERYRREPTPGRSQALRQYGLCPAAILMEVE